VTLTGLSVIDLARDETKESAAWLVSEYVLGRKNNSGIGRQKFHDFLELFVVAKHE